jgi:hypothetical protein
LLEKSGIGLAKAAAADEKTDKTEKTEARPAAAKRAA